MQETSSMTQRAWRVLRWAPLAIMLLTLGLIVMIMLQGGIKKVFAWYALQLILPALGLILLVPLVIYVIVRRRMSKPVLITGAALLLSLLPAVLLVIPVTYPASISSVTPSATVRLPADVPLKVFWGGDTRDVNQHVVVPDQRWAYDLGVEPYLHGSTNLEDYGCYGVTVVAPISGEVVSAHDGEPDMTPGVISEDPDAILGNHVVIKMETGTYLVIAHLKLGSVVAEVGDRVEEGLPIGQCGNSGHTSEPHIHIHHQREDPNIFPVNFAEGLPLYFRDHNGEPMPQGGVRIDGDIITATGDTVRHIGE
jgi:hypothetical protein